MGYCTVEDVRSISKLTTSEVSDEDLQYIIEQSTFEINRKINIEVTREKIEYIDEVRKNKFDGFNNTYYVKNCKGKYLADRNYDGNVSTSDVLVYIVAKDGVETKIIPQSIVPDEGKFVLSESFDSSNIGYVSYSWSHWDEYTPHQFLNLACAYLSAANSFLKKDTGVQNVKFGNVSIYKKVSGSYSSFYTKYQALLRDLMSSSSLKECWQESKVRI